MGLGARPGILTGSQSSKPTSLQPTGHGHPSCNTTNHEHTGREPSHTPQDTVNPQESLMAGTATTAGESHGGQ